MKTLVKFGCAAAIAGACGLVQAATTYYVDANSAAVEPDGASWATAYRDIQSAVDRTVKCDRVLVTNGIYKITSTINIPRGIILESVEGPKKTIIDGQKLCRCVNFKLNSNNDWGSVDYAFAGFTVTNGFVREEAGNMSGGGMYAETVARADYPYLYITNCVFADCHLWGSNMTSRAKGGGLAAINKTILRDIEIYNCSVTNLETAAVSITANSNGTKGGGLYLSCGGTGAVATYVDRVKVHHCRADNPYMSNCAVYGGGVQVDGNSAVFTDCDFYENELGYPAVYGAGVCVNDGLTAYFTNCLFKCNRILDGKTPNGGALRVEKGEIVGCSFINNTMHSAQNGWGGGAAIYTGGTIRDCYFSGNEMKGTAWGIIALLSNGRVVNSYIGENTSAAGYGAVWAQNNNDSDTTMTWVQGCVIVSNEAPTCAGVTSPGDKRRICVEDSIFIGNKSRSNYAAVCLNSKSPTAHIRNCLMTGNEGKFIALASGPSVSVENCTIADNTVVGDGAALKMDDDQTKTTATSARLFNTVVTGNKREGQSYNLNVSCTDYCPAVGVTNSWCGTQQTDYSAYFNADNGSYYTSDDPKYTDAAAGNYSLQKKSPLCDKGALLPWMLNAQGERDKRVVDLGDGSWSMTFADATRKTGMKLSFGKQRPRVGREGTVDIGAYEYYNAPGLMLLVK